MTLLAWRKAATIGAARRAVRSYRVMKRGRVHAMTAGTISTPAIFPFMEPEDLSHVIDSVLRRCAKIDVKPPLNLFSSVAWDRDPDSSDSAKEQTPSRLPHR
jgi:hypothetical protein